MASKYCAELPYLSNKNDNETGIILILKAYF